MNIQKYLLPASVAATVHVALLWFLPEESYVRIVEVPLVAPKPPPPERPVMPPEPEEKPEEFTKEVRPAGGGPTPPDLPEVVVTPKNPDFVIHIEERSTNPAKELKLIPKTIGPGDIPGVGDTRAPDIFNVKWLDNEPRAKVQVPPDYPYAMKQSGTAGSVLVEFDVDPAGRVTRAEAVNFSDREFVEPALRAVRKWRFEPGRREGKAVAFRMTIPIEFSLEK